MTRQILKIFMSFFIVIVVARAATAQSQKTVTGTVYDDKGVTLPGATVTAKSTNIAVVTNVNGQFTISFPANVDTLVCTFIGTIKREIVVGKQTTLSITLKSAVTDLSDVVVIGYGSQKRGDVNGAISSIKGSDIQNIPQPSVDQMIQGKASGVTVTQNSGAPGSQTSVHIRGVTSLNGSNEPLYVIDGVPVSGDAANNPVGGRSPLISANNGETAVSPLSLLNPGDIESIDVLKDASATAIYGNRAANGVIIITTKKGKVGTGHISYDGYYGFQEPAKYLDMMNLQQYANLENSLDDAFGLARRSDFADPSLLGSGTDWQRAIFRSAPMQNHQVSVSGGNNNVTYYISGGYLDQQGIAVGSDFDRYSFRSNIDGKVNDWFRIGVTMSGSRTGTNTVYSDNGGIIYNALLEAPEVAVYNADGSFAGPPNDPNAAGGAINPVAQALSITNRLNSSNFNGNLYNDIIFSKDLTLRSEIGTDLNYSDNKVFVPTYSWGRFTNTVATLDERDQQSTFWDWKEYLTYKHVFARKHDLTVLAGHEVQRVYYDGTEAGRSGFYNNTLQTLNLGQAATATNDEYEGRTLLESFYTRAIYTFNGKYSLTATLRQDKTSVFAEGHNVGYFPSFAASWRLSDEPFMAGIKAVADNIKIRLGYGQVGNQDVGGYLYGSSLAPTVTGLGTGFLAAQIANPNLTWQTSIQYNAGVDFSLFNSRIEGSFDYYDKTSANFLFQLPLPEYLVGEGAVNAGYLGGINPPYENAGKLDNRGFDITLTSHNIANDNFKWNTTVIFSHYKNTVESLANGLSQIIGNQIDGFVSLPVTRTVVGGPIGEFYGYEEKGIFKTDAQLQGAPIQFGRPVANNSGGTWLGDVQYVDVNHDGKIDANDQVPIGNPNPTFTYGITNSFNYKAFDLNIFLNGSYGAKIMDLLDRDLGGLSTVYVNQYASVNNFWTPANSNSNTPAPKSGTDNPNLNVSDRFVQSGSYLRVQNINLGWNLPAEWLKSIKLSHLRLYTSVQNLYTFTKYKGYDPEVGLINQNPILSNIDIGRYPTARTFTFGVNATF